MLERVGERELPHFGCWSGLIFVIVLLLDLVIAACRGEVGRGVKVTFWHKQLRFSPLKENPLFITAPACVTDKILTPLVT